MIRLPPEVGQGLLCGDRLLERRHERLEALVVEGFAAVVVVADRGKPGLEGRGGYGEEGLGRRVTARVRSP